jgi:hypothetical protein
MARRSPFEPDPEFEYPLPYRLAQFLLGASGQFGDYTQGLAAQSKGASDVLESEARLDVSRDELRRRREESAAKLASRQQTNQFFQNLARQGPGGALEGITDPANMDPAALKFALEHLIPKRFEPPATAAPGVGVYNPATGQYDVKVPERPPATAAPGAGIYNPQTGQYDVKVPERPPQTAAPGAGIYNPATGQYDVKVPEGPPRTAAPGAGIYNPETGQYDVRVPKETEPKTPTETVVALDAARARLAKKGILEPTKEQLGEEVEEGKGKRAAETAGAIEKARLGVPNPMRPEESKLWRGLISTQNQLDDIDELIASPNVNLSKIAGGIRPWVTEVIQTGKIGSIPVDPKLFGGPLTREENQLLAALYNAADLVLRQRSGAAINESEFERLMQIMANPGVQPDVIKDRLALQRQNNLRELDTLEHQARSMQFLVPTRPERRSVLPPQRGGAAPAGFTRVR